MSPLRQSGSRRSLTSSTHTTRRAGLAPGGSIIFRTRFTSNIALRFHPTFPDTNETLSLEPRARRLTSPAALLAFSPDANSFCYSHL
jgi:hypothetical protein